MLPQDLTLTVILMALFASCGGCAIKYLERYKHCKKIKVTFLFADLFIAAFSGFFIVWLLIEHDYCSMPEAMLVLATTGFFGSKLFDIGSYLLYKKLGVNIKFNSDQDIQTIEEKKQDDSTRNTQQKSQATSDTEISGKG